MTFEEFRLIDSRYRNEKPKLFLLSRPDRPATEADLGRVEDALGLVLPVSYRAFLSEFGGGSYGLATVFSADSTSDFYLPLKQREAACYLAPDLLAFSDDFAGGNYVLQVVGGTVLESVLYWNRDGGLVSTPFRNVLEYVARYGYEAA